MLALDSVCVCVKAKGSRGVLVCSAHSKHKMAVEASYIEGLAFGLTFMCIYTPNKKGVILVRG